MVVGADQPPVEVSFEYADENDPGPCRVASDAPVEGGPDGDGDHHLLVLGRDTCTLAELSDAWPQTDGSWRAGSGAVWDLSSHQLRPDGWTSADAAGLPILPGLVRDEEVEAGWVGHAIRFTAPRTPRAWVWPARHGAGHDDDPALPPMGAWLRLRSGIDPATFPPQVLTGADFEVVDTTGLVLDLDSRTVRAG